MNDTTNIAKPPARPTDAESLEIAWVATHAVTDRPLLTAFAAAWPGLRAQVEGSTPVA